MAVQSPNQYISGPSMWAEVPDVPGQLLQGYQQLLQQQATPDEEELRKALALREQYMQERGNAAPTYMPSGYEVGSLASVPHTAGYAGPTRVSDLLFPQPIKLRTTEGNAPLPGAPGRKVGELTDLLANTKGLPKEGQDAMLRGLGMDIKDSSVEAAKVHAAAAQNTPARRALAELNARRTGKKPGSGDAGLAGLDEQELRIISGAEAKDKNEEDRPFKAPAKAELSMLQNTYDTVYHATPGSAATKRLAATEAAQREARQRRYEVNVTKDIFGNGTVQAVAPQAGNSTTGRTISRAQLDATVQQFGGDRAKALAHLKAQGITGVK